MAESVQTWDYLESLQGVELHRLYRSPPSALAVFRKLLSDLAKQFVMAMLYSPRPTLLSEFELMVNPKSSKERFGALDQLHRYHVVKDVNVKAGKAIALVPDFARSLRQVLAGGGPGYSFGQVTNPPAPEAVSIDELDDYSRTRWEGILGFMVGSHTLRELQESGDELAPPSAGVIELLRAGNLISVHGTASRGQTASVTKEGFAFVLKDVNTQVWALLFLYVESAEALEMDKIDVLSFIFFISSLELGLSYSISSLTKSQERMLRDLTSLGIIYQADESPTCFYPTRLATTLTSSNSTAIAATSQTLGSSLQADSALSDAHNTSPHQLPGSGFIIIETNFRFYAYTSSPLQIALISLFIALRSRHPNMVAGKLTKQSIQRAIQQGITAEQITEYLKTHAHPQMRRMAAAEYSKDVQRRSAAGKLNADGQSTEDGEGPIQLHIIPRTITDQISLWQQERDRIYSMPGYLLRDFTSHAEYMDPCRYADETGVLLWKDDKRRCFFVSKIEGVQAYLKEKRERANATAG